MAAAAGFHLRRVDAPAIAAAAVADSSWASWPCLRSSLMTFWGVVVLVCAVWEWVGARGWEGEFERRGLDERWVEGKGRLGGSG
jgi:hypothetical protein